MPSRHRSGRACSRTSFTRRCEPRSQTRRRPGRSSPRRRSSTGPIRCQRASRRARRSVRASRSTRSRSSSRHSRRAWPSSRAVSGYAALRSGRSCWTSGSAVPRRDRSCVLALYPSSRVQDLTPSRLSTAETIPRSSLYVAPGTAAHDADNPGRPDRRPHRSRLGKNGALVRTKGDRPLPDFGARLGCPTPSCLGARPRA